MRSLPERAHTPAPPSLVPIDTRPRARGRRVVDRLRAWRRRSSDNSQQSPASAGLRVVTIEAIERRLAETGPNALLRELATSNALLTRPADAARVAIISYRQESSSNSAAATTDAVPDLTLDGDRAQEGDFVVGRSRRRTASRADAFGVVFSGIDSLRYYRNNGVTLSPC